MRHIVICKGKTKMTLWCPKMDTLACKHPRIILCLLGVNLCNNEIVVGIILHMSHMTVITNQIMQYGGSILRDQCFIHSLNHQNMK